MKFLYLSMLCMLLLACKKDDASSDEFILHVRNYKVSCSGYEGQNDCYLVQRGPLIGTEDWEYFYEQIAGFSYEEGFKYALLIKYEDIKNPPQDAPNVSYVLIKQLSKITM